MGDIEHWIGVRMAAGYDEDDLRDAVDVLRLRRDFAEVVLVESAEVPQPRGAVQALESIDEALTRALKGKSPLSDPDWMAVVDARDLARRGGQCAAPPRFGASSESGEYSLTDKRKEQD